MNAIVIVDEEWGIGRDNDLLVHLPGELKYFREKTLNKVIVIGRKTLESFPNQKPLPNRRNVVLTSNESFENEDCTVCVGVDQLMKELSKWESEDVFIAGGEQIYRQFIDKCNKVFVTKIYHKFQADKHFVNMDERDDFQIGWIGEEKTENGFRYQFFRYDRI